MESFMKAAKLLVWVTQLGISIAAPLFLFVYGSVWLRDRFGLGAWILAVGIVLGILGAADGLRTSLKAMGLFGEKKEKKAEPPAAFNEHE